MLNLEVCGIYEIRNNINNKFYIGSSINIKNRWRAHRSLLNRGIHPNIHLQFAWTRYGAENFSLNVLFECKSKQLLEKEQQILNDTKCTNRKIGYNVALEAIAPMMGRCHTEKSKQRMSEVKMGRHNSFFGKKHSRKTKNKIAQKKLGRKLAPEHRKKVLLTAYRPGEENHNAKLTAENVFKLRKDAEDFYAKHGNMRGFYVLAHKEYNVHKSTLQKVVKKETWKSIRRNTND